MRTNAEALNLKHIIDFISDRWSITKREIAAVSFPHHNHTNLSRYFYADPEKLDELFDEYFNTSKNDNIATSRGETSIAILPDLKTFLETKGFRSNLEDMWDWNYEQFVKEILKRANQKPPKNEYLMEAEIARLFNEPVDHSIDDVSTDADNSQNESETELREMLIEAIDEAVREQRRIEQTDETILNARKQFKIMIKTYHILDILEDTDSPQIQEYPLVVDSFLNKINGEILKPLAHTHKSSLLYGRIIRFTQMLKDYTELFVPSSTLNFTCYSSFNNTIIEDRDRMLTLLTEICSNND